MKTTSKLNIFVLALMLANSVAFAESGTDQNSGGGNLSIPNRQIETGITLMSPSSKTDREKVIQSLNLTGLDGVKHTLHDWNGKVIVINFWATWCSSCLVEIRDFVSYQKKYKTRGLQIIGVGLDEEKKLRNVQRTLEINYPVLVADPVEVRGLMEKWGNDSGVVPYTVIIGRNGKVSYAHRGAMSQEEFDEYVVSILDKA